MMVGLRIPSPSLATVALVLVELVGSVALILSLFMRLVTGTWPSPCGWKVLSGEARCGRPNRARVDGLGVALVNFWCC
jgi:hypothetical protein